MRPVAGGAGRAALVRKGEAKMRTILAMGLASLAAGAVEACPDWRLSGAQYGMTGDQLFTARSFRVVAGGENHLPNCRLQMAGRDPAIGYAATAPDFTFTINGLGRYELEFRVISDCDSTLLLNTGAANYYFDDDDNGNLDPKIRLTRPSEGIYDVWIGTIGPDTCQATLYVETF